MKKFKKFTELLKYYVDTICGDKANDISKNLDIALLFIGRHKGLLACGHSLLDDETAVVLFKKENWDVMSAKVVIKPAGIGIQIDKPVYNGDNLLCTPFDVLSINETGYQGIMNTYVLDDSKIEYSGLKEYDGLAFSNHGGNCNTMFCDEGIMDNEGNVIIKFQGDDNIKKFDELRDYHKKKVEEVQAGFHVGEFNVVSINVKKDNEETVCDKTLDVYSKLCNELNVPQNDFIVNNIDMLDCILSRYKKAYKTGAEIKTLNDTYMIPFRFNSLAGGVIKVSPNEIKLVLTKDVNENLSTEDTITIKDGSYEGSISTLLVVNHEEKKDYLTCTTKFNELGIKDGETTIFYNYEKNQDRFNEILELHNQGAEAALEDFSNKLQALTKPIEVRCVLHPNVSQNVNPDDLVMKNGEIYVKRGRK